VPQSLSKEHLAQIKQELRQSLGRDLTPDELRYLGLSLVALPDYESSLPDNSTAAELADKVA